MMNLWRGLMVLVTEHETMQMRSDHSNDSLEAVALLAQN